MECLRSVHSHPKRVPLWPKTRASDVDRARMDNKSVDLAQYRDQFLRKRMKYFNVVNARAPPCDTRNVHCRSSIMPTAFAHMDHRMPFSQESAGHYLADDQLVVARRASAGHSAVEKSQGILDDRRATVGPLDFHVREGVLFFGKSSAEMNEHVCLSVVQNIDDKRRAFR